jgi:hypothetical protein
MSQYRPLANGTSQNLISQTAMPFMRNNSEALMNVGIGLISGRTPQEQAAMGLQGFQQGLEQNKTLRWLDAVAPNLAAEVRQGRPMNDAFAELTASRTKKAPFQINGKLVDPETYQVVADFSEPKGPSYDFKTLPDGTYGNYDQTTGQFSPLGSAPKADDYTTRQQQAQQLGMSPDDPRYQSYILTGKFPREDAQPLTATDKKAILEADEQVSTNQNAIGLIDQALKINDQANSGFAASTRATAGNYLPDWMVPDKISSPESSQATTEYDNLVQTQALQQLKTIFGGNPTEGERAILLELQASSSKPPAVRENILKRAKELASKRLEFNQQRANELRGGTYYKPGGGSVGQGNRTSTGATWSVVE